MVRNSRTPSTHSATDLLKPATTFSSAPANREVGDQLFDAVLYEIFRSTQRLDELDRPMGAILGHECADRPMRILMWLGRLFAAAGPKFTKLALCLVLVDELAR
jgi:hypothetical protein